MSGRALLFLLSTLMVIGSLVSAAWLLVTGQADSFDGLFLFLSSLVIGGAFFLYLKFLISNALRELQERDKKTDPSGAPRPLDKRTAA
jgi:hypothetical protein